MTTTEAFSDNFDCYNYSRSAPFCYFLVKKFRKILTIRKNNVPTSKFFHPHYQRITHYFQKKLHESVHCLEKPFTFATQN
jgi:hypothetical protein